MGTTRERMVAHLELCNYSATTKRGYLSVAKRFVARFMRPAEELGEPEVRGPVMGLGGSVCLELLDIPVES
jgi:hypothetical protein